MKKQKQEKSTNQHPDGGTIDPKLDRDLADLVKKGYIERLNINGEIVYHITPLGDKYVEEILLKGDKKSIEDLP